MADHAYTTPASVVREEAAKQPGAILTGRDNSAALLGVVIAFPGCLPKPADKTAGTLSSVTLSRISAEVERMPLAELHGAVGQAFPANRLLEGGVHPAACMFKLMLCLCRLLDAGNVLGPVEGMDA